ncbi:MAG: hypothetical protein ABII19_00520, partial [Patescibacteria group bacterium]
MFKKIFFIFAALSLFIFSGQGALAQENQKSWDFEKWSVDISINEDSTFLVRESQSFNFHGHFHWTFINISKNRVRSI